MKMEIDIEAKVQRWRHVKVFHKAVQLGGYSFQQPNCARSVSFSFSLTRARAFIIARSKSEAAQVRYERTNLKQASLLVFRQRAKCERFITKTWPLFPQNSTCLVLSFLQSCLGLHLSRKRKSRIQLGRRRRRFATKPTTKTSRVIDHILLSVSLAAIQAAST